VDAELHAHGALAGAGLCADPEPAGLAAALLRVLHDPDRAARLAAEGRARALAHTPDRYAAAMLDVYAAAVTRRRGWTVGIAA
jgi:glycosyltransferase involved in cell wall biosynthesis